MPKKAKSDREWKEAMHAFADSLQPRFSSGQHPRCEKWRSEMKRILDCPKHKRHVSVSSFFQPTGRTLTTTKCTCTYHKCYRTSETSQETDIIPQPTIQPTTPTTPIKKGNAIVPGRTLTPKKQSPPPIPKEPCVYSLGNQLPSISKEMKVGEMKESYGWIRERNKLDLLT